MVAEKMEKASMNVLASLLVEFAYPNILTPNRKATRMIANKVNNRGLKMITIFMRL
jgi:hypothetical protein